MGQLARLYQAPKWAMAGGVRLLEGAGFTCCF